GAGKASGDAGPGTSHSAATAEQGGGEETSAKAGGGQQAAASSAPASPSPQSDSSGRSDTVFDPVVMLIVAGVLTIAIAMTLMRRRGGDGEEKADRKPRDATAMAPPTPEGEIVGGGERTI